MHEIEIQSPHLDVETRYAQAKARLLEYQEAVKQPGNACDAARDSNRKHAVYDPRVSLPYDAAMAIAENTPLFRNDNPKSNMTACFKWKDENSGKTHSNLRFYSKLFKDPKLEERLLSNKKNREMVNHHNWRYIQAYETAHFAYSHMFFESKGSLLKTRQFNGIPYFSELSKIVEQPPTSLISPDLEKTLDKGLPALNHYSNLLENAKMIPSAKEFWKSLLSPEYYSNNPAMKNLHISDWLLQPHSKSPTNLDHLSNRNYYETTTSEITSIKKHERVELLKSFDSNFNEEQSWKKIWLDFSQKCLASTDPQFRQESAAYLHYWSHLYDSAATLVGQIKQYNGKADGLSVRSEITATVNFINTYLQNAGITSTPPLIEHVKNYFAEMEKYIHPLPPETQHLLDQGLHHIRHSFGLDMPSFNHFLNHIRHEYLDTSVDRVALRPIFDKWTPYGEFLPQVPTLFEKRDMYTIDLQLMNHQEITFNTKGKNEFMEICQLQNVLPHICSDIIDSEELHQTQINHFGQVLDTTIEIDGMSAFFTETLDEGEKIWNIDSKCLKPYGGPKNAHCQKYITHDLPIVELTPGTTKSKIFSFYETSQKTDYMRKNAPILCDQDFIKTLKAISVVKQNLDQISRSKAIPNEWMKEYRNQDLTLSNLGVRLLSNSTPIKLNHTKQPLYKHLGIDSLKEAKYIQSRWGISKIQGNRVDYRQNLHRWWDLHDDYKNLRKNPKSWVGQLVKWHTDYKKSKTGSYSKKS